MAAFRIIVLFPSKLLNGGKSVYRWMLANFCFSAIGANLSSLLTI